MQQRLSLLGVHLFFYEAWSMIKTTPPVSRVGTMKPFRNAGQTILFFCCLLLCQCWSMRVYAQCNGTLGDAIFKETFDSAASNTKPLFGPALSTTVTNYPYYSPTVFPAQATGPNQGQYTICNTSHGYKNNYFVDRGDHTSATGRGYMMVVDANKAPGKFYDITVGGLCSSSTFEFSAWIMNINPNTATSVARPSLRFDIYNSANGVLLASISTGTVEYTSVAADAWVRKAVTFTLPPGVNSVELQIISNTPNDSGNDLALDDIAFAPCGPMVTFSQPDTTCTGGTAHVSASLPALSYTAYYFQLQTRPTGSSAAWADYGSVVNNGATNTYTFNIANAQPGQDYRVLSAGGSAEINNTSCRAVSDPLSLYVYGTPSTATVGANQELCNATGTTLTGNTPTSGTGAWSQVSGPGTAVFDATMPSTTVTGLQNGTYVFRWTISNGSCTPSTADVQVIVDAALASNTITAPAVTSFCGSGDAAVIIGSTPTGGNNAYTYQWQSSTDNVTFTDLTGATAKNYDPPSQSSTVYYRRYVTSGPCTTPLYSNVVTITVQTVLAGNTITAPASTAFCGTGDAAVISGSTPTGGSGVYAYQWQSSTNNTTWTDLSGVTTASYDPPVTGVTMYYRRVVTSGSCTTPYISNVVTITVTATLTSGAIGNSLVYCGNTGPVSLMETAVATGASGVYTYQWQSSTTSTSAGFTDISGATSVTYTTPALTQTTYYRRVVSSSPCPDAVSNVVALTINPPLTAGVVGSNQAYCVAGDPNTFTESTPASGGNGAYTYQWQRSTDNITFADISGATAASYDEPSIAQTTYYRRIVRSNGCTDVTSNVITVTINDMIDNNTIDADQTICANTTPATLEGSLPTGSTGTYSYLWQSSTTGTRGFTTAPGVNNGQNYSPGALTKTTIFRRIVTSGPCTGAVSNTVQVSVTAATTAANAGPGQGSLTVTYATLNGNTPANGTGAWSQVSGPNTANIINGTSPGTGVTGLVAGTYVFRWTISNPPCGVSTDDVSIVVNAAPVANNDNETIDEDTPATFNIVSNDTDADGSIDAASITIVSQPAHGVLTVNSNGTVTYTPDHNCNGSDNFTYTVNDNLGATSNVAQVVINVNAVNDPPLAVDDFLNMLQGATLSLPAAGILSNDVDDDGDQLTAIELTNPGHGTANVNADGSITYTPDASFFGQDQFDYKACDPSNACATATVYINVGHVNHPPMANVDVYTAFEDQPLTVQPSGLLSNDTDPDNDPLTATLITPPLHGTVTVNADGSFVYTPDLNYNGPDVFTYSACDGSGACSQANATINITPVNDTPVAVDDNYNMDEDAQLVIAAKGVLVNDTDVDGDPLTATVITGPAHGTLSLNSNGSFVYTPDQFFTGVDVFTYNACDNGSPSLCDDATVTIIVNPVEDTATAVDDHYTTTENEQLNISGPGVLQNDIVKHGTTLTANLVTQPANGSVIFRPDGSFTYTPNDYFDGVDTFQYSACSSRGNCDTATVFITVTPVNYPPVAGDDAFTLPEDTPLNAPAGTLTINDKDPDGDPLTTTLITTTAHGTVTVNANGGFVYTPNPDYNGQDTFMYKVCDNGTPSLCDTATVVLTITPVNDAPIANGDVYTTDEDTDLQINAPGVLTNDTDVDGDALTANLVTQPVNGILTFNADGSFTYHPNSNYNGLDSFIYRACDGFGACDTAIVHLVINPVNDAPVATDDNYTTSEDTALTVNGSGVLFNDSDPDGDALTATLITPPVHGTLILNTDGTFTYTPATNYNGIDSFVYKACDPSLLCANATVRINVTPVNDAPIATPDTYTTAEDTPLTVPAPGVLGNDTDVDGDVLTATQITPPANGSVTMNGDGSFTYTPNKDFNGTDIFTYSACDGSGACDTTTVTITVTPVNDPPVANPDAYTTDEGMVLTVPAAGILFNDTDVDGDVLNATLVSNPLHGSVVVNTDGSFTYTPNPYFNGKDSFVYKACDPSAACSNATVVITVNDVNFPPVANTDTYDLSEDQILTVDVATGVQVNDTDPDGGDILTSSIMQQPAHGQISLQPDGSFVYTPNPNYNGRDTLIYQLCDNGTPSLCDTAIVFFNIAPVNDPPVVVDDHYSTTQGVALNTAAPGVLANDYDVDGDVLTVTTTPVSGPSNGTVTLSANGAFIYTPNAAFTGDDQFTYQACDPSGACNTAVVTITVNAVPVVPQPPQPVNDAYTVTQDAILQVLAADGVLSNDISPDNSSLISTVVTQPLNGTLQLQTDGSFVYKPNAFYNGSDMFTYQACNTSSLCAIATVNITITPVNYPPLAVDDQATTPQQTPVIINVLLNDTDPESGNNTNLTSSLVTTAAHGTVTRNPDGTFTYTPEDDFVGQDYFVYQACDNGTPGQCSSANAIITVTKVNRPPVANGDVYSLDEDTKLTVPATSGVLVNDTDPDNDPVLSTVTVDVLHGTLALQSDGSFVYTPAANYNGLDSFIYKTCDASGACDTAIVKLVIQPVNDPPVAVNDMFTVREDTVITFPPSIILINDYDPDGDVLTGAPIGQLQHGTYVANPDGTYTYTPALNFNGVDSIQYQVCDPYGACDTGLIRILVTPVDDPPIAAPDYYSVPEDSVLVVAAPGVLANDHDVDDVNLVAHVTVLPKHGTINMDVNGGFTYTPVRYFSGEDTLSYQVCDAAGACDTANVYITVLPVNNPPVGVNDTYNGTEDQVLTIPAIGVLANDSDPDGDPITSSLLDLPLHGGVILKIDGSFVYTPDNHFNGLDVFTYNVCDNASPSLCATAKVFINIAAVQHPPVANPDSVFVPEDSEISVPASSVTGNDENIDGGQLSVSLVQGVKHGSLTFNGDGSFTYRPNRYFRGRDSLVYRICNLETLCDDTTVYIIVTPVNHPPVAMDDYYILTEDTIVTFNPNDALLNDSDPDGDVLTGTPITQLKHGTYKYNNDGSVTYTPDHNYNGLDSIQYKACDPYGACDTAWIKIVLLPVNDPPVAVNDLYSLNENTTLSIPAPGFLANDSDPDGDVLNASLITWTKHGRLIINRDNAATYIPDPYFNGQDTATYFVYDPSGLRDTALAIFTVIPVNNAPVANSNVYALPQDSLMTGNVLLNDSDPDGDPLSASLVQTPSVGTLVFNSDGTFVYTPPAGFNGSVTVTYQACDNGTPSLCDTALLTFIVIPPPHAPVAMNDTVYTPKNTPATGNVLTNDTDPDGNPLTATPITTPQHGTITMMPDGSFTYTPATGYAGIDSVLYKACDNGSPEQCDTATLYFFVDIRPIKAVNDSVSVQEGAIVSGNMLSNDTVDGDRTVTQLTNVSHGQVVVRPDGTFTYAPTANFEGVDSFMYKVCNDYGCDSATVYITVSIMGGIKIPNTFTPNGDGKNEIFKILGIEKYPNSTLYIYNRWGNLVFVDKNYQNTWKATGLNEGTYYYLLLLNTTDGEKPYKGWVLILR